MNQISHIEWYNRRHNELLGLLKEAVEISRPKRHEEALRAVQEKCIEDQFDVVLLGEFQDGKSTTLDVLCRGRELSPQGDGIKSTSAVPVSIEVARPESAPEGMREWADLYFKSESQIKNEIFNAFEVYFSDSEQTVADELKPFIEGNGTPKENFCEKFNLGNAEHFGLVRKIVGKDWENYAGNKGSIATHHRQQLEVLTIYLKYYGTPEYKVLTEKKTISVSDVAKYVYFPKDWKKRAPESLDFDLSFAECIFAFLDFAVIHIQSEILSRLNCRVTDCPGLGASAYDTAVARRALLRADGVWFVKKCDKQLGASTLGTIFDLIKDNGRLQRTGMALNLWKGHKKSLVDDPETGTCLVNYCMQQLTKERLIFPVFWCNARFAYLSALGKRKIEDKSLFTVAERKWMMEIIDEDERDSSWSDEVLWCEAVKAANLTSKVKEIKGVEEFGSEAVDLLWRHSNMDEALEVMAKIVLEQKGRTILIDSGSKKAFEIIKRYEHDLQLAEDNATKDAEQVRTELEKARKRMDEFVKGAKEAKKNSRFWSEKPQLVNNLADDFIDYILGEDFSKQFAGKCAATVHKLNRDFHWTRESFRREFAAEIHPILLSLIQDRYANFDSNEWHAGSRLPHVFSFYQHIDELNESLAELVEKLEAEENIFGDLPFPKIGGFKIEAQGVSTIEKSLEPVVEALRQGFWGDLKELAGWIFLNVLKWIFGASEEDKIRKIQEKLQPKIEDVLDSNRSRNKLKKAVAPMFEKVIDAAAREVDSGIEHFRNAFEARCKDLETANSETDARKREIAAENHKVRTEKVQPLREKLEEFEKTVEAEL